MIEGIFINKKFIEEELSKAPSAYISVYLMTLAYPNERSEEIARLLNMLESDVLKSWNYWVSQYVLDKSYLDNSHIEINIEDNISLKEIQEVKQVQELQQIQELKQVQELQEVKEVQKNDIFEENLELINENNDKINSQIEVYNEKKEKAKNVRYLDISSKQSYTVEELSGYMENEEIVTFIQNIHSKFSKPLKDFEISMYLSFHDYYGLPLDVIDVMVDYIIKEGKTNLKYMEKVAITWADANIQTVEQAVHFANNRKRNHKAVMMAFGKGHETPLEAEIEFMKVWFQQYNMDIDLVAEACKRTVDKIEKASFKYANGIIKNWYENNIKTLEEVESFDQAFRAEKEIEEQKNKSNNASRNNTSSKPNKFTNFENRELNFDALEELQRKKRNER